MILPPDFCVAHHLTSLGLCLILTFLDSSLLISLFRAAHQLHTPFLSSSEPLCVKIYMYLFLPLPLNPCIFALIVVGPLWSVIL